MSIDQAQHAAEPQFGSASGHDQCSYAANLDTASRLSAIEARTSSLVSQFRWAIGVLLHGSLETSEETPRLSAYDLDQWSAHWLDLVPVSVEERLELTRQIAATYKAAYADIPRLRAALGLDEPAMQEAHLRHFGLPLPAQFAAVQSAEALLASGPGEPGEHARRIVERQCEWVQVPKGEVVIQQGTPSDCLYVVAHGRLRAVLELDGGEIVLGEAGRGETIGEMGLLTGEPRSSTVYALRDTTLLRLSRASLDELVETCPQVLRSINQLLIGRLREAQGGRRRKDALHTILVVPASDNVPVAAFTRRFAEALGSVAPTLLVSADTIADVFAEWDGRRSDLDATAVNDSRLVRWLNDQELRYRYIVYQGDGSSTPWTRRCLQQGDALLVVARGDASPSVPDVVRELGAAGARFAAMRQDLVVLHPETTIAPASTAPWLQLHCWHAHHHVRLSNDRDMRRVARRMVGSALGVALGGGGARGFAHIGVLKAIEEAGLEVDLVGGSSAGALIAAQYAMGWDFDTMVRRNQELATRAKALFDYTVPFVSIFAAERFTRAVRECLGEVRIEDLWLPFFCVSSNLSRADEMVHQFGPLWRYVRASCSIPGGLPPVLEDGELLVDGAVLNNVPADVAERLCAGGPVLAVDVAVEADLASDYRFEPALSGWQILLNRVLPFRRENVKAPNIMSVLMRAAQLSSVRTRLSQSKHASLYLSLPVEQFGLFDVKAFDQMIDLGYEVGRTRIAEWLTSGASGVSGKPS